MNVLPTLVIVSTRHKSNVAMELSRVAHEHGWSAMLTRPDSDGVESVLNDADQVIFRIAPATYPMYETLSAHLSGTLRDQLDRTLRAFDKIETDKVLSGHDIPTPRTWTVQTGEHFRDGKFVIKIPRGNQGQGVALIEDDRALQAFFAEYPDEKAFLAQEFIAEAASGDKRLFVVGDRVVASMRRQSSTDDFRANIHLGGQASVYIPTKEEEALAIKSTKAFGLDHAGVDIIDSIRGPLVLEVNPSPGFAISGISGIDVAEEVFNHITRSDND